jgi:hypothetical protein
MGEFPWSKNILAELYRKKPKEVTPPPEEA